MRPIPAQGRIPTREEFRTRADAALTRAGAPCRGRKEFCGFREWNKGLCGPSTASQGGVGATA